MKSYNQLIKESIDSYLMQNIIVEDKSVEDDENKKPEVKKNAIKGKGGLRKDLNVKDEKTYNQNVDDQEQSSVMDILSNGFVNIKKVAEKLYPDHTPEGAQSQLNKKLTGAKSDSGSTYKLKKKEVKRLRNIIATFLNQ